MSDQVPLEIRVFRESDESEVVALWTAVFGYDAPHNEPRSTIRHKLAVQPELFWLACVDGKLVGTIMAGYDGHRGWLYSLAVAPEMRRRGIGSALMTHGEQQLIGLGCPKINLQILPSNAGVARLYERLGYTVEERVSMGKRIEK